MNLQSTALPIDPFYIDKNYNDLRRLKLLVLADSLNNSEYYRNIQYDEKINYIKIIENSCLDESIRKAREYNIRCVWEEEQFVNIYHSICYKIFSTVNITYDTGSNILIKKIFNGDILLDTIASKSYRELCPEKYEEIKKKIDERSNMEENIKYTELYFCKKCKRNQCTASRVQTRSLDEGSSFHITCLFCGNRWFGG